MSVGDSFFVLPFASSSRHKITIEREKWTAPWGFEDSLTHLHQFGPLFSNRQKFIFEVNRDLLFFLFNSKLKDVVEIRNCSEEVKYFRIYLYSVFQASS